MKIVAGGGKKRAKFWAVRRRIVGRRVVQRRVVQRRVVQRRVVQRRVVQRRVVQRRGPSEMGCRVRGFGFSSGFWGRKQKQNKNKMKREMSENWKKVKKSKKTKAKEKKEREKEETEQTPSVRLRPINFDFGQFRLRPISTSANFDFGQLAEVELSEVELAEIEHPRAMVVPVMVTTVEIVRFRLSAAPMKRTRPSCFGRPAAVLQAQKLRCRFVHVDDAGRVHIILRHVAHQAQSELVHVRVWPLRVRRLLGPA